jgi:hypothetical protein
VRELPDVLQFQFALFKASTATVGVSDWFIEHVYFSDQPMSSDEYLDKRVPSKTYQNQVMAMVWWSSAI